MAGYKETPRQKMIAMMYLVLTALLALNVSKDILEAFLIVNESMEETNETFENKLGTAYNQFDNQFKLNQNKVGDYWDKAQLARQYSDEVKAYLDQMIFQVVKKQERKDSITIIQEYYTTETRPDPNSEMGTIEVPVLMLAEVPTKDKYDEATNYFIVQGKATELREVLEDYKARMLLLVDSAYRDRITVGLETGNDYYDADGARQSWEMHNFYHTILAASVTILNKIRAEVQTLEFDIVSQLYSEISITDFKFDEVGAKVIPKSNYVIKGDEYQAEVLVAAYDSKQIPDVYVLQGATEINANNKKQAQRLAGEDGVVQMSWPANTEGIQRYAGVIELKDPEGNILSYPFEHEYIVAPPSLTVAATKMNVFYISVPNPVSISVPGVADAALRASISTGTLERATGDQSGWIVNVPTGQNNAIISVSAMFEGELRTMGSAEFRVKRVPDPVAQIAGQVEGQIEKNTLVAAGAIIPVMKDFEFELYFNVTSFRMATVIGGDWISKRNNGNRFSEEMLGMVRNSRRGQKFFFENITAEGPDKVPRGLNPIALEIK